MTICLFHHSKTVSVFRLSCGANRQRWQNTWPLTSDTSDAALQLTFLLFPSQVGGVCRLSTESSLRRCRTPDGKICSGRGKCECGVCFCTATDPGKFYGPRCECQEWVCATFNGKTCNGAFSDIGNDTLHIKMNNDVDVIKYLAVKIEYLWTCRIPLLQLV